MADAILLLTEKLQAEQKEVQRLRDGIKEINKAFLSLAGVLMQMDAEGILPNQAAIKNAVYPLLMALQEYGTQ